MGARGPKPLPANVHLLRGNPSKLAAADLTDGLQPEVEIPSCPKHLWAEAKKEWRRITPELERYGLISKLDRNSLAKYCQAWAQLVWNEEQLSRAVNRAEAKRLEAEARGEEYEGGNGVVIMTSTGYQALSGYWIAVRQSAEAVARYEKDFGLNPCVRNRTSPSSVRQRDLFADEGEDKGGYGAL
jgi:P27 family predicted phage terminase small subunit